LLVTQLIVTVISGDKKLSGKPIPKRNGSNLPHLMRVDPYWIRRKYIFTKLARLMLLTPTSKSISTHLFVFRLGENYNLFVNLKDGNKVTIEGHFPDRYFIKSLTVASFS